MAHILNLAPGTIRNNVSTIMSKLHSTDCTQAVLEILRAGMVDLEK